MQSFFFQLLPAALIIIGVLLLACIVRAVKGPHIADRLVAVNMMTTLVSISVCILSVLFAEGYLADVALVFSMLGCLAVIVLTRVMLAGSVQESMKEEQHVD